MAIEASRALAAVEQARKAAQAVADMQVQRAMARTGNSANAVAAARSLAAIEQAEAAARKVASDGVGEAMRQRMAQSGQQAQETQQRAREAEQRALEAKAQADEAQRRMREETQKESRATGTYRVSTIFLAVLRPDSDAKVKAEIEAIEKQIRGGVSFRDMARQHSQDPAAKQGGDLGWVAANQLEAPLRAVVTGLQVGELSRPVRGGDGWYLLGLQATAPAGETRQGALGGEQNSLKQKDATLRSRLWEDVVNNQPYGSLGGTAEERALFDAARKLPVVMHNLEVDARVYRQLIRNNNLTPSPEALSELKRRTAVDVTREKLALQGGAEIAAQTGAKISPPRQGDYFGAGYYSRSNGVNVGGQVLVPIVSHRDLKERAGLITMIQANLDEAARKIDAALPVASGPPKNLHTTRWLYTGDDVTVTMQIAAPVSGWAGTDAKFNTIVDATMKDMSGKIAAAAATAKAASKP
jgi:parvulin-like peptidyl-prolyl isomerase